MKSKCAFYSLAWTVALFLAGLLLTQAAPARTKVILDTDIGGDIDDAWALGFILANADFEPVGVTICDGYTAARAKVACKLLNVTGRSNVPVAVGRQTNQRNHYQFTWAEDFTALQPIAPPAAQFLVEMARKNPGEITLIAIGPLQNVADALRLEPGLGKLFKRVVLMSGCVYGTAYRTNSIPESNVVTAIKDAQLVYGAGLPLTIVPLDSTTHVTLREDERDKVRKYQSPLTRSLECLYRLWLESPQSRMTLHDQMAVAETASPGTFFGKKEILPLYVDDKGCTRIDEQKGLPVTVCLQPKRDAFLEYYIGYLTKQQLGQNE